MPLASTTTCPALVAAVLRAGADAGAPDWVPAADVAGAGLLGAGLLGEAVAEPVVVLAGGAGPLAVRLVDTTAAGEEWFKGDPLNFFARVDVLVGQQDQARGGAACHWMKMWLLRFTVTTARPCAGSSWAPATTRN